MNFLDSFTLGDLFIAITGIMVVSLLRIYYDSYIERRKIQRFVNSLGVYNNLAEDGREGILIVSDRGDVIFANPEAHTILQVGTAKLDRDYLEELMLESESLDDTTVLLTVIRDKSTVAVANLVSKDATLPVSLTVDKVPIDSSYAYDYYYVVVLRDMTGIHELQEGARALLT